MTGDDVHSLIRNGISALIFGLIAWRVFFRKRMDIGNDNVVEEGTKGADIGTDVRPLSSGATDRKLEVRDERQEQDLLESLADMEKTQGPLHLDTLSCLDDLLAYYQLIGDEGKAWDTYWRQMRAFGVLLGIPYTDEVEVLARMSDEYIRSGNARMGEMLHERAVSRLSGVEFIVRS